MSIQITCPHCGVTSTVDDQLSGQTSSCGSCGKDITIPYMASEAAGPGAPQSSSTPVWLIVGIVVAVGGLVVLVCGGILVALLLPAVSAAREAARRTQCTNNMKQIAVAMQNYEAAHGSYPPAYVADETGKPMHSWRVLILPFMEEQSLYEQYDFEKPWDSPENLAVTENMPDVYRCPSSEDPATTKTNYVVVMGTETMFNADTGTNVPQIIDGVSRTLLVVESTTPVHWSEPVDLDFAKMSFLVDSQTPNEIGSEHNGGAVAAFADASVQFLRTGTDPELIKACLTKDGGEEVNRFLLDQ